MNKILIILMLALAPTAYAKNDTAASCPEHFTGAPPSVHTQNSREFCEHGFYVYYAFDTKTPIVTAHHLTRARVKAAGNMTRTDSFRAEERLPKMAQATLDDYKGSGYDRGHLVPNGDMGDETSQYDSFSLINIAPQIPEQNRGIWRKIESNTRALARRHGEVYVVTGIRVIPPKNCTPKKRNNPCQIGNGVSVPTHFFKAVYIPKTGEAGVYYAPNDTSGQISVISLDELKKRTQIDAMPSLPSKVKSSAASLPTTDTQQPPPEPWWVKLLKLILKYL